MDAAAEYPVEELEQVWRRGSSTGLGLAIGAGVGLIGGAIGGAAVTQLCILGCSKLSDEQRVEFAVIGGLLGSVAGGTIGAFAGAFFGRWKTVYKSQPHRLTPVITTQRLGINLTI
jgi:hypothetical protein